MPALPASHEGAGSTLLYSGRLLRHAMIIALCTALGGIGADVCAAQPRAALPSKLAPHSLLLAADQTEGLMVAVGERGHILYSEDRGENWHQAQVPSRTLLTAVHLYNRQLGWAVGHDSTILRSRDGGKVWQLLYSAPEDEAPLLDVWFKDDKHGLAVGAYGLLLKTDNGGDDWQRLVLHEEDDFHLNQITPLPDGSLLISAETGALYRSNDDGETWQPLASPYHGSLFGGLALKGQLLIYGLRGHLFNSRDRGEQWQAIDSGVTTMLTSALQDSQGRCFIGGLGGVLLLLPHCDGSTVEQWRLPNRGAITALLDGGDGSLILVGEFGVMRYRP